MSGRKLCQLSHVAINPMDVNVTYKSYTEFIEREGHNPLMDRGADHRLFLEWRWVPSFKKAQRLGLDSFLYLLEGGYPHEGIDQRPDEDRRNNVIYKDYDYILLYTQEIGSELRT